MFSHNKSGIVDLVEDYHQVKGLYYYIFSGNRQCHHDLLSMSNVASFVWGDIVQVFEPPGYWFYSLFFRNMSLSECAFKEKENKVYLLEGKGSDKFQSFFKKKSLQLFKKYLGDIHWYSKKFDYSINFSRITSINYLNSSYLSHE